MYSQMLIYSLLISRQRTIVLLRVIIKPEPCKIRMMKGWARERTKKHSLAPKEKAAHTHTRSYNPFPDSCLDRKMPWGATPPRRYKSTALPFYLVSNNITLGRVI